MHDRCYALPLVVALLCVLGWNAQAAGQADLDSIKENVEELATSGGTNVAVFHSISALSAADRMPLLLRLLDSPEKMVRYHALLGIRDYPPKDVAERLRKMLTDDYALNRSLAAGYLARQCDDAAARALLIKEAADNDPQVAEPMLLALGFLKGQDVGEALARIIQSPSAAKKTRLAAISAAGNSSSKECAPSLMPWLDNREPRELYAGDTARVCDIAVSALEQIHSVYRLGVPAAYLQAPVDKRDEGIGEWKQWYAAQSLHPDPDPHRSYVGKLLNDAMAELAANPPAERRAQIRDSLNTAFRTTLCLGYLPGVDAVVTPTVKDAWKIMQVMTTDTWYQVTNFWADMRLTLEACLKTDAAGFAGAPDQQALAFIRLALQSQQFPRQYVWSLCRDFPAVFPASGSAPEVRRIQEDMEAQFAKDKKRIVLHGHTAVLEPSPIPPEAPKPGGMVPEANTAAFMALDRDPSNWENYRKLVDLMKARPKPPQKHEIFTNQMKLYPGNELPYLGMALYYQQIFNDLPLAAEMLDKAAILNPDQPLIKAIRDSIDVAAKAP